MYNSNTVKAGSEAEMDPPACLSNDPANPICLHQSLPLMTHRHKPEKNEQKSSSVALPNRHIFHLVTLLSRFFY